MMDEGADFLVLHLLRWDFNLPSSLLVCLRLSKALTDPFKLFGYRVFVTCSENQSQIADHLIFTDLLSKNQITFKFHSRKHFQS